MLMYAAFMDWLFNILGIDPARGKRVEEQPAEVSIDAIKEVVQEALEEVKEEPAPTVEEQTVGVDFTKMTKAQLVEYGASKNIELKMTLKKNEMIDALIAAK